MDYKSFSLGFFASAAFGTIVCMPLSAAGLVLPTVLLCVAVFIFAALGFLCAMQNNRQEREALRMTPVLPEDEAAESELRTVIELLTAYESAKKADAPEAEVQEKKKAFTEGANAWVLHSGECCAVSPQETAAVSLKKARQAQTELMRCSEQDAPKEYLDRLQLQADTLARIAVRDMRVALQKQKSAL